MTDSYTWRNVLSEDDFRGITDVASKESIAIQPQYAASPKLTAFCEVFQTVFDGSELLEDIFKNAADPDTAIGDFLDWLGDRVGISRTVETTSGTEVLDDDTYRTLVFFKALANISSADAERMNELLSRLLGITVWVIDKQDMTIDVRILGTPTAIQLGILRQYGILNRGAGVKYNIVAQNPDTPTLGFENSGLMPFNLGAFNPAVSIDIL